MPATTTRTPRTGRPRTKAGTQKAVMFRWPRAFVEQLHALADEEERSINTAVFRLLREALAARGQAPAVSATSVDTAYATPAVAQDDLPPRLPQRSSRATRASF